MEAIGLLVGTVSFVQSILFFYLAKIDRLFLLKALISLLLTIALIGGIWLHMSVTWVALTAFSALQGVIGKKFYEMHKQLSDLKSECSRLSSLKYKDIQLNISPDEFLQSLAKSPAPQIILSKSLHIVFMNESFFQTYKLFEKSFSTLKDTLNKPYIDIFPTIEKNNSVFYSELQRCVTDRTLYIENNVHIKDNNGNEFFTDWSIVPINSDKILLTASDKTKEYKALLREKKASKDYKNLVLSMLEDPQEAITKLNKSLIQQRHGQ